MMSCCAPAKHLLFNSGIKADSSAEFILGVTKGLRMTFKDRHVGGRIFQRSFTVGSRGGLNHVFKVARKQLTKIICF
jgi:hypothetical protein